MPFYRSTSRNRADKYHFLGVVRAVRRPFIANPGTMTPKFLLATFSLFVAIDRAQVGRSLGRALISDRILSFFVFASRIFFVRQLVVAPAGVIFRVALHQDSGLCATAYCDRMSKNFPSFVLQHHRHCSGSSVQMPQTSCGLFGETFHVCCCAAIISGPPYGDASRSNYFF